MTFSRNYLSAQSQPWAREVQKRVTNLESAFRSAEVNNTTRDDQLAASFRRLDATFLETQQAAADAQQAASDALAAINGLTGLGTPGGDYEVDGANLVVGSVTATEIDANYVYAGTISANQITSGSIDANVITVTNLDASNITTGSLSADRISGGTISGVTVTTSSGGNTVTLNNGVISISGSGGSGQIRGAGGYNFELFAGSSGTIFVSANSIAGDWADFAEFGDGGSRFRGEYFPRVAINNQSTFAANVFLNSSGEMFRDPTISSREAKENIEEYAFDTEAFISVNPVTFEYKEEAFPQLTGEKHLGFILEDFEEAGLGEHLSIPANEIDKYKGLRYDKLYMFLHKTVQELNERVRAIENG